MAPRPPAVDAIADDLLALYRDAWESVQAQERALTSDPALWRQRRRLADVERSIRAAMDDVDRQARAWVQARFPELYGAGAVGEVAAAGVPFRWSQIHREAVAELAAGTFDDLLAATSFVRDTTKRLIRTLAREATRGALVEGRTAVQVGRELARRLDANRITAVVYRDGSRHGLAEYSQVVVRTKTAHAFNAGALNQLQLGGVGWVEVFDGAACGWRTHDDPDKANATFRTVADAAAHPLAHPNCRRALGGRPDITTAEQAAQAAPSTTVAQRADQAASEAARAGRLTRRARVARTPRVARH